MVYESHTSPFSEEMVCDISVVREKALTYTL